MDEYIKYETNILCLKDQYIQKLKECEKIPKPMKLFVRSTKTNKLYSYIIETIINYTPNFHELKNKIIYKTKKYNSNLIEFQSNSKDMNILFVDQYKEYL